MKYNHFFEAGSQFDIHSVQEVDFSKAFSVLQQAFSKNPQPVYLSKSSVRVRNSSRSNSFVGEVLTPGANASAVFFNQLSLNREDRQESFSRDFGVEEQQVEKK